jgi:anti-sigma B factor antagonist
MKLTQDFVDGVAVLRCHGRFDAHETPEVRKALADALGNGHTNAIVNLQQVNFIDSSGLATLVQGMKHCRAAGGDLYLCHLGQPLRVIFELTRLDKAFDIYATEEQALAVVLAKHASLQ